jgi:hypothetical protein
VANNPFFDANVAAFGGQVAKVWRQTLDSWWDGLLADGERLRGLAERLAPFGDIGPAAAAPADLAKVVTALELLGGRQEALEARCAAVEARCAALEECLRSLAGNVADVVTFLERLSGDEAGPRRGGDR